MAQQCIVQLATQTYTQGACTAGAVTFAALSHHNLCILSRISARQPDSC
jgi:hypothetical protein